MKEMDTFLLWVSEHYPVVFLVIAAVIITWIAARKWFLLQHRVEENNAKTAAHHERLEKMESTFTDIRETLLIIKTYLMEKDSKAAKLFSGKASPRKLNENGQMMYRMFGGNEFMEKNQQLLIEKMEARHPQTAHDVEIQALEVLYECVANDIFDDIKMQVYNCGTFAFVLENGEKTSCTISTSDVCFIFSIELRNRYLTSHPEVRTA